jgi:thiamine-monophosphate kinase
MADAVTGGDDYEVLFTLAPENLAAMRAAAKAARVPVAVIGTVSSGHDPLTVTHRGETFLTRSGSFSHF